MPNCIEIISRVCVLDHDILQTLYRFMPKKHFCELTGPQSTHKLDIVFLNHHRISSIQRESINRTNIKHTLQMFKTYSLRP